LETHRLTVSDLIMRDLEERALETLNFPISFYVRYVDDITIAVPAFSVNGILNVFNEFHLRLQFTLELGGNKLNFLDITLLKINNSLEFN